AVPLTMNIVTLFANMDLLAKAGWNEIPATYDDLMKCCDDLLAAGITPFGCAGTETWCVTEYLEPIIEKTIGYEKLNAIFAGTESWNDPAIATAVDALQSMVTKGYFAADGLTLGNDQIRDAFAAGAYAFYQNGSWNCGKISEAEGNFKVALFPVMDAEKATYGQVIGGPSDSLAVSAHSPPAELAAKIAFERGKDICHYGYLAGAGLPAWTPDYDTAEVLPLVKDVAEIVANADGMVLFGDTAMSADPANIYLDYVSKVYGVELDGNAFIEGLAATLQ
ncbi:MAG: extracellular solute-binding protein, partial [Oscillospiraceae bacterium]|nr:extracellular solute-binding protein [Oscillospiraceae bacterium]